MAQATATRAPHILVLRAPGTNCDRETAFAFESVGATTTPLHVNALLKQLEKKGSLVILCGTCLDYFELTARQNVGTNGCMGDVRESMAMERVRPRSAALLVA